MFEAQLKKTTVPITLEASPSVSNASVSIARLAAVDGLSLDGEVGLDKGCLVSVVAALVILVSVLSDQRTIVSLANAEIAVSPVLFLAMSS